MIFKPVPRHQLSKSTFMYGVQCPKRVWLHKNLPKERDVQSIAQTRIFQQGTDVGLLAQQLFPGGINAEPENFYSYQKSVADTQRFIRRGHQVIYEAAFQFEGILCAVDILVKINHKWYAYEVKSTNSVKSAHILDAALQYYVIINSGIDLVDFNIIHLNRNYIRQGELNIALLFKPTSVLKEVIALQTFIASTSVDLLQVLSKNTPPDIEVGEHCMIPYPCDFQTFCNNGVSPVNYQVEDEQDHNQLADFADNLEYPISFLSLQSWSTAIPQFDGHWPYKQVCFQYSLHKQYGPGEVLEHDYFLEEEINAGQKELIENLVKSAGQEGSIVVHNDSFVKYHLQELKKQFIYLDKEISSIQSRIIELIPPFRKDLFLEENFQDPNMENGAENKLSIIDSSSAAAAFCNMREEVNEYVAAEIKSSLFTYGNRSSLDLAMKIDRWRSF